MFQLLAVGIGGAAGAVGRYAIGGMAERWFPAFAPAGTLIANVSGCLLIGVLMVAIRARPDLPPHVQAILVTGFLGSLTTFSTFSYETLELFLAQQPRQAVINLLANVLLGLAAVALGLYLARLFTGP